MCDPEVATVNSLLELTVGSSSKEKPTVRTALTVDTRFLTVADINGDSGDTRGLGATLAGGAYMPPFGMYAIMPPRIAAPRAPVHSGPIAKRSHPSQNDVWSARISLADLVS